MTPAERAFVEKLKRRAATLAPDLARAELAAFDMIRFALNERELTEAIRSGAVDELIAAILSDDAVDPALRELRARLTRTLVRSAELGTLDLPSALRSPFNILNPRVLDAARALDTRVISNVIKAEMRETFRQTIMAGLEAGQGPRTIARAARASLGLAPNQSAAIRNFERMLREGDRTALKRALRDRRFDRTLARALGPKGTGLSAQQIERMSEAYRRRMIAFNAETHARTAAIDAQKAGQRLSWEDAIDRGVVDRDRLIRTWVTVGDSRVRPEHKELNGTEVGFDETFPNGELTPGESTYNCRCAARVTIRTAATEEAA